MGYRALAKYPNRLKFFVWGALGLLPMACSPKVWVQPVSISPAQPQAVSTATPPPLNERQLLGQQKPPGLVYDLQTAQRALPDVMEAYQKLKAKAAQDGWSLVLVSGYRSYWAQVVIWNSRYDEIVLADPKATEKERVQGVLEYVDLPGLSRHHWGTELDISEKSLRGQLFHIAPDLPERVKAFYGWMEVNAPSFGFCKTYRGGAGAIHDEPWHWSYLPFSCVYQEQFKSITDFKSIKQKMVKGSDYILTHFDEIYRWQAKSVDASCGCEKNQP